MIQTLELVKKFGRKTILKKVSLELEPGVYGLLGPNGSGKTTFVRCLIGIYKINSGQIKLNGDPVGKHNNLVNDLGYLPQKFGMYKELKVYEALEYLATLKRIETKIIPAEIERCLELVHLSDCIWKRVGTLSGGMMRRLGIAAALLGDPKIMIFDEPTSGLDPEERIRFKNIIKTIQKNKIILISTHIIEDVEALCDRIIIIREGEIIRSGTLEEIAAIAKGKVLRLPDDIGIPSDGYLAKIEEHGEGKYNRILSRSPILGGVPTEPTVEDGYMCAIKNI